MKTYQYIPLVPQLIAYFLNRELNEQMCYRSEGYPKAKAEKNGHMMDMFNGSHYLGLLQKEVTINSHGLSHTYFSDPHNVALGLATDGVNPWQQQKSTFWPILFYNFNLLLTEHAHGDNAICIGEVLGPKKPKDMDFFLYPAVQELLKLLVGVKVYDVIEKETFILRVYLLTIFGDILAISMLL